MPKKDKCGDCRFWLADEEDDNGEAECRHNSPTVVAGSARQFALIHKDKWCGQFRRRGNKTQGCHDIPFRISLGFGD